MGHNGKSAFPLPSEVASVAGAEGWEDLYPYFSRFRPEDDRKFWFYNSMHFPEPMPAFDAMSAEIAYMGLGAVTARVFAFPTVLGIEYRILNGRVYITSHAVTDPKKIEERLALFQERAGHYYQNWSKLFGEWQTRMTNLIAECAAIHVPELGEYEPAENVKAARGFAENHELREAWDRTFELYSKMWHHHFEFLMLGYGAYLVFFQFCKKAFPEIQDQSVARMVAGIDVLMFRPDDELKRLAAEAVKHGVDGKFVEGAKPDDILASLRQLGEPGRKWLAELEHSREPWFNISSGDGFYHHQRSWNDDLSVPFAALPRYIRMIKAGENMDRPTEALKQERARIVSEYRALLATDDDRGTFDQMLGSATSYFRMSKITSFTASTGSSRPSTTRFANSARCLRATTCWSDAEDIFQLRHREADEALADLMLAWAAGIACAGGQHFKPIVKRRREILKALEQWNAPPALGPMPDAVEDPAVQMLWGITSESLQRWSAPVEKGRENEVTGFAASPGVIEGVARVLKTAADIGQILDGEILVCPVTNPSWGPVFGRIKAAVSDIGGTMSHAAIVAREYGLPAVVGTGQATKRITTGQRLRVDGNRGVVTILG